MLPPNVLAFSGGAPVDREGGWADSRLRNRPDLVGAQRRPLQAYVGRPAVGYIAVGAANPGFMPEASIHDSQYNLATRMSAFDQFVRLADFFKRENA